MMYQILTTSILKSNVKTECAPGRVDDFGKFLGRNQGSKTQINCEEILSNIRECYVTGETIF